MSGRVVLPHAERFDITVLLASFTSGGGVFVDMVCLGCEFQRPIYVCEDCNSV